MRKSILLIFLLIIPMIHYAQKDSILLEDRVISSVDSSHRENVVLTQTFEVNVPINKVWDAYSTENGWESWASPVSEINFKIGGLIQTNYDKNAKIGDAGTIRLHIINYVPQKMITLQAELTENFPDFMKEDEKRMFNTVLFEAISPTKTKIISYGIGYQSNPKYQSLLKFFIAGNEKSYQNLISYLETGKPSIKY